MFLIFELAHEIFCNLLDSESAQLVEIWKRLLCRRMLKLSFKFLCRDHGTKGIRGVFGTPFFDPDRS